ncbi:hypothetical protein PV05_11116 [Exophiala xenobiotica]|uniref:Uncharacterized protein n=1 Tax=Exophiala xenobiotica TaxID=348802 RepID=A0A0D2CI04_9EURO|nr:uncharacterized protein PV05_11116 [Exophiala xenobiotica]KIW49437.1 hypothetical protein PV05_11116 [Exophiala xenobiotica]
MSPSLVSTSRPLTMIRPIMLRWRFYPVLEMDNESQHIPVFTILGVIPKPIPWPAMPPSYPHWQILIIIIISVDIRVKDHVLAAPYDASGLASREHKWDQRCASHYGTRISCELLVDPMRD